MADERLPAITLTDTNNQDKEPSRPFSPTGDAPPPSLDGAAQTATERPVTPTDRVKSKSKERSGSSPGRASPGRLRRSRSNNAGSQSGPSQAEINGELNEESQPNAAAGIDPLSQHILSRTNVPFNTPSGRNSTSENVPSRDERTSTDKGSPSAAHPGVERTDSFDSIQASKDLRKGVKAVAFINRLMGNKKKEEDVAPDDESVSNEGRPEGTDAECFQQPVDNIGFSPQHPQPPAYIKVRSKFKKERFFDRLFLAQELDCRKGPKAKRQNSTGSTKLTRRKSSTPYDANTIWAMEFSRDGKYLAAAGVDSIVRVWAVISSLEDRQKHERQESSESEANGANPHAAHLSAPVFQRQPVREYEGHTSTILDLSWSKNNFLLSSSMDKTVRLWHISRSECLCTFKHNDFVPSIAFHPKDDRFFLAGSLDSRLRLWSIPDKSVAYAAQLPDMITAVAFTPDGKYSMAGCLSGVCSFFETEGMKYQSQIHVRSSRGQNAKGSKITGIQAYLDPRGDTKLLITSNDSRVRIYNFRDKNLELKFRGNENNYSQIRASISDDGRYVVCGSEDRKAYIWSMGPSETDKRDKRPLEMFEAHNSIATVVCFAPAKTRVLLGKSEDPLYDLCNPPPVTLMSREERAQSRAGSQTSSRPGTENGSIQATPADTEGKFEKPKESASYISRSGHRDGNIIVTADFTGSIKVFRQDCAWSKRRNDDDRASIFSKRNGRLSRTGSMATRGSQPSLREGKTSTSMSGPSDRILSWRQGIASSPSVNVPRRQSTQSTQDTSRSISPSKSLDQRYDAPTNKSPPTSWTGWGADAAASDAIKAQVKTDTAQARAGADSNAGSSSPKSNPAQDNNPLMLQGGQSYLYWDTEEWKARAERMHKTHEESVEQDELYSVPTQDGGDADHLAVRPSLNRGRTDVSQLSDERESASSEYDDAKEENDNPMKCRNCGSFSFKAKKTKSGGNRLICTKCGERAS